jgi:superfamily II RNA helicase
MVIHCTEKFESVERKYKEYFDRFPYPLSDFQKWAIYAISNGHHSLVTAHTGSGKTLPAEFAIQFFKEQGKKVIYTGPIKALCNQKLYDLKLKFPHISFGILTGDVKDNPEADVLIMTTEILRNTLFNKQINSCKDTVRPVELQFELDIENDLGAVVFDEVHYIGDQDRGSVWEQAILLLPPQVQLIMLSATIEKPEIFAEWLETEKNKNIIAAKDKRHLYMTTTYERVVPLTHYAWFSSHPATIQGVKNTSYEQKFKEIINKPLILASPTGTFNDINFHKLSNIIDYHQKNKIFIKRQFVLNELIGHLNRNNMLPAICFVFSRKNVELCAKEVSVNLFHKDDKTPSIIEHECEKILIGKLKNYKEYMALEEYRTMISLLKKGIAIHHAGIMPILREMVELLFEKKYIKLLFATETFAVGINMPTKTVIFSSVSKFSGTAMRYLLSHEYTQMAGRAGRRGIDTIGHVIHCNNLFNMPDLTTYKKMLTGPPKMLVSQFKISFNLILNIISANGGNLAHRIDNELITFMEKSFIQNDIVKELNSYDKIQQELEEKIAESHKVLNSEDCKTPLDVMQRYNEILGKMEMSSQKQKKKFHKQLATMNQEHTTLKVDLEIYNNHKKLELELEKNGGFKLHALNYIQTNVDNILSILKQSNFLEYGFGLTEKGNVAMHLQEVHSLALGDLYHESKGFAELTAIQLVGLFSCFTNISMASDKKSSVPADMGTNKVVKTLANSLTAHMDKYYTLEYDYQLDTGADYTLHFELIDDVIAWCSADNETVCIELINKIKKDKEVFLGEFVKAILKINNIAKEFEKICEFLQNLPLLQKIKEIPQLTLKYVATNQSLYI